MEKQPDESDDRVYRRSKFVADVREEPGLQFVGTPERGRPFLQLRVESDYTAIGLIEFKAQARQFSRESPFAIPLRGLARVPANLAAPAL